jgi:hypothetical protein
MSRVLISSAFCLCVQSVLLFSSPLFQLEPWSVVHTNSNERFLLNHRTIKLSNYQTIKLSNYQTIKLSPQQLFFVLFLHLHFRHNFFFRSNVQITSLQHLQHFCAIHTFQAFVLSSGLCFTFCTYPGYAAPTKCQIFYY